MIITNFFWNAERKSCVLTVEFCAETFEEAYNLAQLIPIGNTGNDSIAIESLPADEWVDVSKLAGLPCMPCSSQGVLRKAKKQKWLIRIKPNCSKWTQIHISNLPLDTVRALRGGTL